MIVASAQIMDSPISTFQKSLISAWILPSWDSTFILRNGHDMWYDKKYEAWLWTFENDQKYVVLITH